MTAEAEPVRQWLGRALKIHNILKEFELAVKHLDKNRGTDTIYYKCSQLRNKETAVRLELYELLSKSELSPRQFTILHLHYLQYNSWTCIASSLNISRRYALQVHTQAIERIASQVLIPSRIAL